MDVALGINRFHAASHYVDFWFPEFAVQCVELAVGIADANVVEVDECQLTDAGTGESFDGPGTDAAKADGADVGLRDSFQGFG